MFEIFKKPLLDDKEASRKAGILFNLIIVTTILVNISVVIFPILSPEKTLTYIIYFGLYDLLVILLLYLNRKGFTRIATWVFISFFIFFELYYAWNTDGIRSGIINGLPPFVLIVDLIIGWKKGISIGILLALATFLLVFAEYHGLIIPQAQELNILTFWISFLFNTTLLVWLQYISVSSFENALITANNELKLRNKIDSKLQESESRLRTVFENMTNGFTLYELVFDENNNVTDFKILEINKVSAQYYNYDIEFVKNKKISEVYGNFDISKFQRSINVALTGQSINFEQYFPQNDSFYKIYMYTPQKNQVAIIYEDITIQMKAQKAKEESENLYKILFENGMFPIIITAADGKVLFLNNYAANFLGVNVNDIDRLTSIDFWDDLNDRNNFIESLWTDGNYSGEARIRAKDNIKRYVYLWSNVVKFKQQDTIITIFNDITDKVIAEKLLQQSEKRLQKLLNSVTDYIYSVKIENNQVTETVMSDGCETVTGYTNLEFAENPFLWIETVLPEDREKVKKYAECLQWSDCDTRLEYRFVHKNGTVRWAQNNAVLRFNDNGRLVGYDGLITDVTEVKELERQILNSVIETEERQRLNFSQEIHDGLGPLLSAAKMYVQWLDMPNAKIEKSKLIADINKLLEESFKTVREISFRLSPHILQNYGLADAIKAYSSKIKESTDINFDLLFENICRFDEKIEIIIYRVICECINNTIKHAQASLIGISLRFNNNLLAVDYTDNGNGFDIDTVVNNRKGIGLMNMESRIKSINGQLSINSSPKEGMHLKFNIKTDPT